MKPKETSLLSVQDVNDDYSLRYPKLYTPGQLNLLFNKKVFAQSIAEGVISSLVLFFIPYGTFYNALRHDGLDVSDLQALATAISAALIVVVTLRVYGGSSVTFSGGSSISGKRGRGRRVPEGHEGWVGVGSGVPSPRLWSLVSPLRKFLNLWF